MNAIINFLKEFIKGYQATDQPWKAKAYSNAVKALSDYSGEVPSTIDGWKQIKGIGDGIAASILEFQGGKNSKLNSLKKDIPPSSVFEFTDIPGVGLKKAKKVFKTYKVDSIEKLNTLLDRCKIKEDWLKRGLETLRLRGKQKRIPLYVALNTLREELPKLEKLSFVLKAIPAGSIRRRKDSVKDFDTILVVNDNVSKEDAVRKICKKYKLKDSGGSKCYIPTGDGRFIDLYVTHERSLGTMLLYLTGSGLWNAWIRGLVKKKGWKLNQYNLETSKGKKYFSSEKKLLQFILGKWVPPECREFPGDVGSDDLVTLKDIKGDLHIHTTKSDGKDKPTIMIDACHSFGYTVAGLADHVGYMPWSMKEFEFKKWKEVFTENKNKLPIKTLLGAEIDVSKKGLISIDPDNLNHLDFVIISSHQQPGQNLEERYELALEKIKKFTGIKIIGHPINRNLDKNVMVDFNTVNWLRIFKLAKDNNAYLEINGVPNRLDLDWEVVRKAKHYGCKFVLGSDAHAVGHLQFMEWAVNIARKGNLSKSDILNCNF